MGDLRAKLEARLVGPLFKRHESLSPEDDSLPAVVLEHRRRRARLRLLDALVSRGSASVVPELRREVEALVRRWAASGFDDGFAAISEFEIRCAREHDLVVASECGDLELELAALEREYRRSVVERFGRDAVAQVDLGVREHRNRPIDELGKPALAILATALRRAGKLEIDAPYLELLRATGIGEIDVIPVEARERPPIITIPEYQARSAPPR